MRILRLTICVIILTVGLAITPALGASHYTVRSSGISLDLSRDGRIVGAVLGNNKIKWNALGETELSGCRVNGKVESDQAKDGKVRFKKRLLCDVGGTQREIRLIEEFIPTKDSVQWEITVDGQGSPWTTPIKTHLHIASPQTKKFWTTWGDPRPDADPEVGWVDDPSCKTRWFRRNSPIGRFGMESPTINTADRESIRSCLFAMCSAFRWPRLLTRRMTGDSVLHFRRKTQLLR